MQLLRQSLWLDAEKIVWMNSKPVFEKSGIMKNSLRNQFVLFMCFDSKMGWLLLDFDNGESEECQMGFLSLSGSRNEFTIWQNGSSFMEFDFCSPVDLVGKSHKSHLQAHTHPRPRYFSWNWLEINQSIDPKCFELSYPIKVSFFYSQLV